jgi:aspartate/methionine/tyrosine aminotransferase
MVAEWIQQTPGTISLGQGVVGYGPPVEAVARIQDFLADPENHKYKPVIGIPELRDAFKRKLRAENQITLDSSHETSVVITAGGNMAFLNALLAVADAGDEVILQSPYYFNHEMAVTMASCRPVIVPTDTNYQLQPELIRQALTSRTRAVVTISPNNPTGAVYPEAALREVNQLCREHGVYHIHDEAYEYFVYGSTRHFSPGCIPGARPHTISLYSLSKTYGFASWRIGAMVIPERLLNAVRKIQDTVVICAPVISQYAALGALQAGADYCRTHLRAIAEVRELVRRELASLGGYCDVPPADGAFYFLIRLHSKLSPVKITERLIREHQVAVIPGNAFGLEEGCHLRIAYAASNKETVAEGVARLVEGLRHIGK